MAGAILQLAVLRAKGNGLAWAPSVFKLNHMLQACLNGSRSRDYHAAVPISASDLARDAQACREAGAEQLHLHPRDSEGRESFDPAIISEVLTSLHHAVPGMPIGLSTREGILADPASRAEAFAGWYDLPDYVSVNLSEADAAQVIRLFLSRGVGVEAGLASVEDAEKFVALPEAPQCLRILIEMEEQDAAIAKRAAQEIVAILDAAGVQQPRQLHGFDDTQWALYEAAVRNGLDQRIGLEDGKLLPDGRLARSNGEMIAAAMAVAKGYQKS